MAAWLLILVTTAGAQATDRFLTEWRKAQTRAEPEERALYYSRAVAAWESSDGNALLADARFGLGRADYELDRSSEAVVELSRTLALDPSNPAAYLFLGRALSRQRRWAEAVRDLETYVSAKPEDEEGWLDLAEAGDRAGLLAASLSACDRARRLAPSDPRPPLVRARALSRRGRCRDSLKAMADISRAAGDRSPELRALQGRCAAALGRTQEALADYDEALGAFDERLTSLRREGAAPVEIAMMAELAAEAEAERDRLRPAPETAPKRRRRSPEGKAGDRIYAN